MTRFAFDIQLNAVARVSANSKAEAIRLLRSGVDAIDLNWWADKIQLTEASLSGDHTPHLFEVDGRNIEKEEDMSKPRKESEAVAAKAEMEAKRTDEPAKAYCTVTIHARFELGGPDNGSTPSDVFECIDKAKEELNSYGEVTYCKVFVPAHEVELA